MNIRKYVTAGLATVVVVALCGLYGCASFSREMKSINSDVNGGLERTVTLYDYNGKEIKSWHGKFDIESNDQEIFFDDEHGKRVIIQGGIVMSEED